MRGGVLRFVKSWGGEDEGGGGGMREE